MLNFSILNSYLFRHGKKSVPFGHKWRISAPGIVIINPKIMHLFGYKFLIRVDSGISVIIIGCTYCPLVLKQYTFSATRGSPQIWDL